MIFFQIVKVHILNFDVLVFFKEFLAGEDVTVVDINSENLCVFEALNNTFEGMACCCSNIKNFFDWFGGLECSFPNSFVGNSRINVSDTW